MDPAKIRLADPAPAYCSGCYQQQPTMTHVDFGAVYDGPMLPALEGAVGVIAASIDDLILCETCVRQAAELVGYGSVEDLEAQLTASEEGKDRLHERIHALEELVAAHEDAAARQRELDALTARTVKPASRRARGKATS